MAVEIALTEKYERQGWPSLPRPDMQPPPGWSLELITSVPRIYNHSLAPAGDKLAFLWGREGCADVYTLELKPAGRAWPQRISLDRPSKPYWADEIPQWSPDGQWLAYTSGGDVVVAPVAGGKPEKITAFTPGCFAPVWLPDSQHLIVSQEIEDFVQFWKIERTGAQAQRLTHDPGDHLDARPSPDGKTIVYTQKSGDDFRRLDLRLTDLSTGTITPLTGGPQQKDWYPRWSPDGKHIAFLSQRSGFNEIWLIQPGDAQPHQLTHLGADAAEPAWSPDGQWLACTVNRQGEIHLVLVSLVDGSVTDVSTRKGIYARPNWSPDGSFMTVEYEDPLSPPDLYRMALPSRRRAQLTFSNPPALGALELLEPQSVSCTSAGGLEIHGLLYNPPKGNQAALVHPHGGPADQYTFGWDIFDQYLAAKGYTILAPNYRGSTGYGVAFEHANYNDWGRGDTEDCLNAASLLAQRPGIDPARIGILGASYGGYMVACCLSRDGEYRFACGVSKFGDADLFSSWALCERSTREYTEMMLGHPARQRQIFINGSPILQVDQVRSPVLLLHGLKDDIVPPQASEEWVEALRRAGKTYEYKTYAGEPHGFQKRANVLDVYARTERFLDWHLFPEPI